MAIHYVRELKTAIEQSKHEKYVCAAWAKYRETGNADYFMSWARGFARYQPEKNGALRAELVALMRVAKV
jgi:hypothetical protein